MRRPSALGILRPIDPVRRRARDRKDAALADAFYVNYRKGYAVLRFCLLGSGSSGNALWVAAPDHAILIDNGLSFRQLKLRAAAAGESLDSLRAVFVTHEHGDHVNGVGTLARSHNLPVYMTAGTRENLPRIVGKLPCVEVFEGGEAIETGGMRVASFNVAHDAADPVSYTVEAGGVKLGIAADLGHASAVVRTKLCGSNALILESNHCPEMLRQGSYPPAIQQRIRGWHGHMSNQEACSLLAKLAHDGLDIVVLVHISESNNSPNLAYAMARQAVRHGSTEIHLATQDTPTPMFNLGRIPA